MFNVFYKHFRCPCSKLFKFPKFQFQQTKSEYYTLLNFSNPLSLSSVKLSEMPGGDTLPDIGACLPVIGALCDLTDPLSISENLDEGE